MLHGAKTTDSSCVLPLILALNRRAVIACVGALLLFLLPHNQSLWIDESSTALYARQPSIGTFLSRLGEDTESESLMPLGMFSYWLWARVVGSSEIALRSLSAAWIVLGVLLIRLVDARTRASLAPILFACHPFAWYYGGEVRPYAMQIALGAGILLAIPSLFGGRASTTRGVNLLCVFVPLLCASGLLAAVPAAVCAIGAAVVLGVQRQLPSGRDWLKILVAGVSSVAVAVYYLVRLADGAGAATGSVWRVGIGNLLFSAYELLGFSGFGPGRSDLRRLAREAGIQGVIDGFSVLGILAILLLAFGYAGAAVRFTAGVKAEYSLTLFVVAFCTYVVLVSACVLLLLSLLIGFPFWGRHLSPLLPFVVYVIAVSSSSQPNEQSRRRWMLPIAIAVLLLASSLLVRFRPSHFRDDYRSAVHMAASALQRGDVVWWVAASNPAEYYGLPLCGSEYSHTAAVCAFSAVNLDSKQLARIPAPSLVFITKPDLFDDHHSVGEYVHHPTFTEYGGIQAFDVYRRGTR